MASAITIEQQTELRKLYDAGVNKNRAGIQLKMAEATVYRYYARWSALEHAHGKEVFDFTHLPSSVLQELKIQATMRRMSLYNFTINLLITIASDNLSASIVDIDDDDPAKKRLVNDVG